MNEHMSFVQGPGDSLAEKHKYSRAQIEELLLGLFEPAARDIDGPIMRAEPNKSVKDILDAKNSDYLYAYIMEALDKDMSNKNAPDVLYAATRLQQSFGESQSLGSSSFEVEEREERNLVRLVTSLIDSAREGWEEHVEKDKLPTLRNELLSLTTQQLLERAESDDVQSDFTLRQALIDVIKSRLVRP